LPRIEEEMVRLSKESLPVERQVMTKEDAKKLFQSLNEPFKVELIEEIEGDYVTVYRQGEFVDLAGVRTLTIRGSLNTSSYLV